MTTDATVRRDARDRAVDALLDFDDGRVYVDTLLDEWQRKSPLSPADMGLAAELALGLARRRITCEHIASAFYRGRWAGLRERLRLILALAVYQLCWLDRIPDHAAIDQAVRQAKKLGTGAGKIANAVLRQVQSQRGERGPRTTEFDPRTTVPLDANRQIVFSTNVFPDPARRPLEYFQVAYGLTPWLIERWNRRFKHDGCRRICEATIARPWLTLRANPLKTTANALHERLTQRELPAELNADASAIRLPPSVSAADVLEIAEGLCQPQDETAQKPLRHAGLRSGMFVVDYCAGAGTKTTQAAELMNNEGVVLGCDVASEKLDRLLAAAARHGIDVIQTCHVDDALARVEAIGRSPDVILVDVPCMNTGVLAKRPEARYRAGQKTLEEIGELQAAILLQAAKLAGPATRIIYSTCSIEQEENGDQVAAFINANSDWRIEHEELTLPATNHDGGYFAILGRTP